MKRGFTLMEIIFVVIAIGMLMSITTIKILNSSRRSQFFGTIHSDVKTILSKVTEWENNYPNYKGDLRNLKNASYLSGYLPSNMSVIKIGSSYYITSSGYGKYLRYAIEGDSPNSFETDVYYGDVIKNIKTRQKYAKQIANVFIKLSADKESVNYDLSKAKDGEVDIKRIVP